MEYLFSFGLGSQIMPTSMPPPRKLPQRPWAASIPTILTHNALHVLLLPSPTPCLVPGLAGSYLCSPLERFLGSVIMRRHLQRIIQQEANVRAFENILKMLVFCFPPNSVYVSLVVDCELKWTRGNHVQDRHAQVPSGAQPKELPDTAAQGHSRKHRSMVSRGASGARKVLWDTGKWPYMD